MLKQGTGFQPLGKGGVKVLQYPCVRPCLRAYLSVSCLVSRALHNYDIELLRILVFLKYTLRQNSLLKI